MHNSKLFKVLHTLSNPEWISLKKYIDKDSLSPQVKQLFAYLFQRKSKLNSKIMDIDYVRSKYFDDMTKKNFQNMMSKLGTATEDFLILKHLKEDRYEWELRRFQVYNDRSLYDLANNRVDLLTKQWSENDSIDFRLLLYLLRLRHNQFFSENPISYQVEKNLLHFLISTLKDLAFIYNEFYGFINEHAISLNHKFYFKESERKELKVTQKLREIVGSFSAIHIEQDANAFDYCYEQLVSQAKISSELKGIMYEFCERFLRRKFEIEASEYYSEKLLEFYEFGMKEEYLLYRGAISYLKFQNIVQTACYIDVGWASNFLARYIKLIPIIDREENNQCANIQIFFGEQNYSQVLSIFNTINFDLFPNRMLSRWYVLTVYFITFDNLDFFESQIINFNQFIHYNKKRLSQRNISQSLNLAKIFTEAIKLKSKFNLKKHIKKYDIIAFKHRLPSIFKQRESYVKKHNIQV